MSVEALLSPDARIAITHEMIAAYNAQDADAYVTFMTDDVESTAKEMKARGVEFVDEPTEQPYGIDCSFRDPSGNNFRLGQVRSLAGVSTL